MNSTDAPDRRDQIRHRFRSYSLRSFMIFVTVVAIWLGWTTFIASHQRAVLRHMEDCGGKVYYRHQERNPSNSPPIRNWIASKIGEEFVFSIAGVYLEGEEVSDDTVRRLAPHLEHLRFLKWLEFRGTHLTDEGLHYLDGLDSLQKFFVRPSHGGGRNSNTTAPIRITHLGLTSISNLRNLKVLTLNSGTIDFEGFRSLSKLSKVEVLDFRETNIDDAALRHFKGFVKLRKIVLWKTDVSDTGLEHLASLPQLEEVYLANTGVTDHGMQLLSRNANLRIIDVDRTSVTDEGLKDFGRLSSLQELRLKGTNVSDRCLTYLAELKNLRILQLIQTNITNSSLAELASWNQLAELEVSDNELVTNDAVVRLRAALPRCRVY